MLIYGSAVAVAVAAAIIVVVVNVVLIQIVLVLVQIDNLSVEVSICICVTQVVINIHKPIILFFVESTIKLYLIIVAVVLIFELISSITSRRETIIISFFNDR